MAIPGRDEPRPAEDAAGGEGHSRTGRESDGKVAHEISGADLRPRKIHENTDLPGVSRRQSAHQTNSPPVLLAGPVGEVEAEHIHAGEHQI